MGSGCDMFYFNFATTDCYFMPHNPVKGVQNLNDVLTRSMLTADLQSDVLQEAVFVLSCAAPQENVLKNSEFYRRTTEGEASFLSHL